MVTKILKCVCLHVVFCDINCSWSHYTGMILVDCTGNSDRKATNVALILHNYK